MLLLSSSVAVVEVPVIVHDAVSVTYKGHSAFEETATTHSEKRKLAYRKVEVELEFP
jgi:hypothetical protein